MATVFTINYGPWLHGLKSITNDFMLIAVGNAVFVSFFSRRGRTHELRSVQSAPPADGLLRRAPVHVVAGVHVYESFLFQ